MIDPFKFTNYNLTDRELEEYIIFSVLVAGKTARVVARQLVDLLDSRPNGKSVAYNPMPLQLISEFQDLPNMLKGCGIGCQNAKAATLQELARRKLNLRTCTVQDLESIKGIGEKTSRFFVLHTRPSQRLACLDTHILKWLKSKGVDVPKNRPKGKRYLELEQKFLQFSNKLRKSPAELDLEIWSKYASKGKIDADRSNASSSHSRHSRTLQPGGR